MEDFTSAQDASLHAAVEEVVGGNEDSLAVVEKFDVEYRGISQVSDTRRAEFVAELAMGEKSLGGQRESADAVSCFSPEGWGEIWRND